MAKQCCRAVCNSSQMIVNISISLTYGCYGYHKLLDHCHYPILVSMDTSCLHGLCTNDLKTGFYDYYMVFLSFLFKLVTMI